MLRNRSVRFDHSPETITSRWPWWRWRRGRLGWSHGARPLRAWSLAHDAHLGYSLGLFVCPKAGLAPTRQAADRTLGSVKVVEAGRLFFSAPWAPPHARCNSWACHVWLRSPRFRAPLALVVAKAGLAVASVRAVSFTAALAANGGAGYLGFAHEITPRGPRPRRCQSRGGTYPSVYIKRTARPTRSDPAGRSPSQRVA